MCRVSVTEKDNIGTITNCSNLYTHACFFCTYKNKTYKNKLKNSLFT